MYLRRCHLWAARFRVVTKLDNKQINRHEADPESMQACVIRVKVRKEKSNIGALSLSRPVWKERPLSWMYEPVGLVEASP